MRSVALLALLGACTDGSALGDGSLSTRDMTLSSTGGIVEIPLDVAGTSALVTVQTEAHLVALEQVRDPNGDVLLKYDDWTSSSQSLTWAFFASSNDMVFNWPIRDIDGTLGSGTWTLQVATLDDEFYYRDNVGTRVTIQQKRDPDLGEGTLQASIAYAEGVEQNPEVVAAVEAGVEHWQQVWAAYGMDVEVSYTTADIDPSLINPYDGDDAYERLADRSEDDDIVLLIGETIGTDATLLGHVGTIPNTLVSTRRSTIAIAWLNIAGTDGSFSEVEVEILGETFAHEAGHYTGLFHPVEAAESVAWQAWDALSDTPNCSSATSCESDFANNLMFPYSICDFNRCNSHDQLTPAQQAVMQRYTGLL